MIRAGITRHCSPGQLKRFRPRKNSYSIGFKLRLDPDERSAGSRIERLRSEQALDLQSHPTTKKSVNLQLHTVD